MDTIAAYIVNFADALQSMEEADAMLKDRFKNLALTETERAEAALARLDLVDLKGRMRSSFAVFKLKFNPGINPPSPTVVAKSLQLAKDLGVVIANAGKAVAIVAAVTKAVQGFEAIANAPAGLAPPVAVAAAAAPAPATVVAVNNMSWLTGDNGNAVA